MIDNLFQERLAQQQQKNLYRERETVIARNDMTLKTTQGDLLDFCSSDYLCLAKEPSIIAALQQGAQYYGVSASASTLISGYTDVHAQFEHEFAAFVGYERALLFTNGYMANIGVLQSLINAKDNLFKDKHNHASLWDAAQLTGANIQRYRHRDTSHLTQLLTQLPQKNTWIVTDAVFSMSGQLAPLPALAELALTYHASLIVDDAHGIGLLGSHGQSSVAHFQLTPAQVPVLICPLGKAFGVLGAMVASSHYVIETLIQFARTYMYSNAIPAAMACAGLASLTCVRSQSWRRLQLNNIIAYFKTQALQKQLTFIDSDLPIQVLPIHDIHKAIKIQINLKAKGIWLSLIRPPSIAGQKACFRITLNCQHQAEDIDYLLDQLMLEMVH